MSLINDDLYEMVKDTIEGFFYDPSIDKSIARDNLQALKDEIDTLLESLED